MNLDLRALLGLLLRRLLPAAAAFALGTWTLLGADANVALMLHGLLLFLVGSIFVAGPICRLLAEPIGGLFWPRRYYDKPQPIYGIPQTLRKKGRPEEAIAEYQKIAAMFPGHLQPHVDMIEIALLDLRDPDRARDMLDNGLAWLKNPRDRETLTLLHAQILSRLPPPPFASLREANHPRLFG